MRFRRLQDILRRMSEVRVLVIGDFFLDQYWIIDSDRKEVSLETGLDAFQVTDVILNPGAAGTVANNLVALGVGHVEALGVIGDDGAGTELLRCLQRQGILTDEMIVASTRRTPIYTKPIIEQTRAEMNRFDIKNRTPLPQEFADELTSRLKAALERVHGIAVLDQVEEPDCGVITAHLRQQLALLSRNHPDKVFLADSRSRIEKFHNLMIKPNRREASTALQEPASTSRKLLEELCQMADAPVFLTCGSEGIAVSDGKSRRHFPALASSGPVDPVGAGDSVSAAIVSSLCGGADLWEAAQFANLVAGVTIHKLGITGTASQEEISNLAEVHSEFVENW